MSDEQALVQRVVHPLTGEAFELATADDAQAAEFLWRLRGDEVQLRAIKDLVSKELLSRMDQRAKWSMLVEGGFKVKGASPQPVEEFDELELRSELLRLVDAGELSVEAVDAAVEPNVTYKVKKSGINALRKLGGGVREVVDAHAREVEKRRYVSVEWANNRLP